MRRSTCHGTCPILDMQISLLDALDCSCHQISFPVRRNVLKLPNVWTWLNTHAIVVRQLSILKWSRHAWSIVPHTRLFDMKSEPRETNKKLQSVAALRYCNFWCAAILFYSLTVHERDVVESVAQQHEEGMFTFTMSWFRFFRLLKVALERF